MNKFLEMYTLPRLNQREIENMNKSITSNETESVIKKKKTYQRTKKFTARGHHRWILTNISRRVNTYPSQAIPEKLQRKERFQIHSMWSPWYQNQGYHKRKKSQTNITDEDRCKNPQKMSANWIQHSIKRSYSMIKWDLSQRCKID